MRLDLRIVSAEAQGKAQLRPKRKRAVILAQIGQGLRPLQLANAGGDLQIDHRRLASATDKLCICDLQKDLMPKAKRPQRTTEDTVRALRNKCGGKALREHPRKNQVVIFLFETIESVHIWRPLCS